LSDVQLLQERPVAGGAAIEEVCKIDGDSLEDQRDQALREEAELVRKDVIPEPVISQKRCSAELVVGSRSWIA
jgi:hypothetical protein